jgi:hypothetical protein
LTHHNAKGFLQPSEVKAPFLEQFTEDWSERWTPSEATKKTPVGGETFSYVGKWEVEEPSISLIDGDKGLVAKSKAAHHAISAAFSEPIDFKTKPLVVQYEVKYQKGGNCGGGYLKLLEDGFQTSGKEFSDTTPWVIMFGPDLTCPGTKVRELSYNCNIFLICLERCTSYSDTRIQELEKSKRNTSRFLLAHLSRNSPTCTHSLSSMCTRLAS